MGVPAPHKRARHGVAPLLVAGLLAATALRCGSGSPPPANVGHPTADAGMPRAPEAKAMPPVTPAQAQPTCAALRVELPALIETKLDVPVPTIVDAAQALAPFRERVASLLRGRAKDHVRIAVFGDSNMTMDWITGEMRRTLQQKYGDAGHGYIALGRPWNWYRHMDVRSGHQRLDWTPFAVSTHPSHDAAYGFAGIAARSERRGAVTWVATADSSSPIGTRASRFDVYYLKKPNAGAFEIRVDGSSVAQVDTDGATREAGFAPFSLPDTAHKLEFVATTVKPVTLFGVTLERGDPSFVVDSLGVGAVSGPLLLRQNKDVMVAALRHRKYDLIALLLGSNQVWPVKYEAWMAELIARFREAQPDVPVLVMSPVDQVTSVKAVRSVPDIRLVAHQNEKIARDNHCAFWDFRGAMGGEASMVRFIASGLGQADGIHLTQHGASYMARRLLYALMRDTDQWLESHPAAACSTEPPQSPGQSPAAANQEAGAAAAETPPKRAYYRVAAIGDSLTAVRSRGGRYLDYLRRKCPKSRFDNYGVGGENVAQMRRRFQREVVGDPRAKRRPRYSHVIVFGGVNDLMNDVSGGRSTAKIIADLDAMYTMARRAGARVVGITVAPWGGLESHYNPRRAGAMREVNDWILAQAQAGKIDLALDSVQLLGCDDGEKLCESFELPWIRDGLHFNEAAHDKLGQALYDAKFSDCR